MERSVGYIYVCMYEWTRGRVLNDTLYCCRAHVGHECNISSLHHNFLFSYHMNCGTVS